MIGIKIPDQIYTYIILRQVTGYEFPTTQAYSRESHNDYQSSQQDICQIHTHFISGGI